MADDTPYGQPSLLGLPTELRVIIYELLFTGVVLHGNHRSDQDFSFGGYHEVPTRHPPAPCTGVLQTCRQIYSESKEIFYGSVTFSLESSATPEMLMESFGANAPLVKNVNYKGRASLLECLDRRFMGLKRLKLWLDWWDAFYIHTEEDAMDLVMASKSDEWWAWFVKRELRNHEMRQLSSQQRTKKFEHHLSVDDNPSVMQHSVYLSSPTALLTRRTKRKSTQKSQTPSRKGYTVEESLPRASTISNRLPHTAYPYVHWLPRYNIHWYYCSIRGNLTGSQLGSINLEEGIFRLKDQALPDSDIGLNHTGKVYAWPQKDWFREDEQEEHDGEEHEEHDGEGQVQHDGEEQEEHDEEE